MRVIAQDYSIDTDYELHTFLIKQSTEKEYQIVDLPYNLIFATYSTLEEAQEAMKQMHMKYSTMIIKDDSNMLIYTDKSTYDELQKDIPMSNVTLFEDAPNKIFVFPSF